MVFLKNFSQDGLQIKEECHLNTQGANKHHFTQQQCGCNKKKIKNEDEEDNDE